jgi:hypothetical protein
MNEDLKEWISILHKNIPVGSRVLVHDNRFKWKHFEGIVYQVYKSHGRKSFLLKHYRVGRRTGPIYCWFCKYQDELESILELGDGQPHDKEN